MTDELMFDAGLAAGLEIAAVIVAGCPDTDTALRRLREADRKALDAFATSARTKTDFKTDFKTASQADGETQ